MPDTPQDQLRSRMARALKDVDKAREHLRRDEFVAASQLARRIAEDLLAQVAITRKLLRTEDRKEDLHLDRLAQILRRGDGLPKRTADHIEIVKRVGNRAAHPQESLTDEVSAHEPAGAAHERAGALLWITRHTNERT